VCHRWKRADHGAYAFDGFELLITNLSAGTDTRSPARHRRVGRESTTIRCACGAKCPTNGWKRREQRSPVHVEPLALCESRKTAPQLPGSASAFGV